MYYADRHAPQRALDSFPTRRSSDLLRKNSDPSTWICRSGRTRTGRGKCARSARTTDSKSRRRSSQGFTREDLRRDLRSEEHTSELQSQSNLVCRLLLEKKKTHSKRQ